MFQKVIFFLSLALSSQAWSSNQILKVATEGFDFKPHYYMENNQKVGFEVDLLKEIFSRLNLQYVLIDKYEDAHILPEQNFPTSGPIQLSDLLIGLEKKSSDHFEQDFAWDMASAALGITEERKKIVDFSDPINASNEYFYGPLSKPIKKIPEDVQGLTVGVEANSVQETYLRNLNAAIQKTSGTPINIVPVFADGKIPAIDVLYKKFELDQFDAIVGCDDIFKAHADNNPLAYEGLGRISPSLNASFGGNKLGAYAGIAFRKDKSGQKLRLKVNRVLQSLQDDCTYANIFYRYFSYENPLIPENCRR